MKFKRWPIVAKVLLIVVALAACAEAALRFGLGLGNPVLIAPDPACAYITKPNQNIYRFFVHTYINRYGMRSEEISPARPPGVVRVLFVGDSITYGTTHVDQRDLFTQIVQRGLPAIVHSKVQVLNASANAWAPDNELSWIESRGIFQSNYVVLVLNDGDLTQPRSTIGQVPDLPRRRPLTAMGGLMSRYIEPRILHIQERSSAGDVVIPNAVILRANLEDLDHFQNLVQFQKGRMILVFLPFRRDIPGASGKALKVLQDWSRAHDVPLIDLTHAIAAHTAGEICIYDRTHYNRAGNAIIGQEILRQWPFGTQPG